MGQNVLNIKIFLRKLLTLFSDWVIVHLKVLIIKIFDIQNKQTSVDRKERKKIMLERVKEIIEEQLNLENAEITEETRFKEDLEVDSLDLFELVMAFEEEYGIEIPSEELENITTVGAVIKYMQDKGVEA